MKLEVNKGNLDPAFMKESIVSLERGSCGVLEVLNELVMYEEIESGGMKLSLAAYNPFSLLRNALVSIGETESPLGIAFRIVTSDENREQLPYVMVNVDQERIQLVLTKILSKCMFNYRSGDKVPVVLSIVPGKQLPLRRVRRGRSNLFRSTVVPLDEYDGVVRICVPLPGDMSQYTSQTDEHEEAKFAREAHGDKERVGLSIWISRRIIALHGGDMGFISSPTIVAGSSSDATSRSSIYIDIPFRKDFTLQPEPICDFASSIRLDERAALSNADPDHCSIPRVREKKIFKILVVDDSSLNRKILIKVMESLGHSCDQAEDGDVAVGMVKAADVKYDIILME
jgi:CheY-like chemotaxis protein